MPAADLRTWALIYTSILSESGLSGSDAKLINTRTGEKTGVYRSAENILQRCLILLSASSTWVADGQSGLHRIRVDRLAYESGPGRSGKLVSWQRV